jgi:hypothetical protein
MYRRFLLLIPTIALILSFAPGAQSQLSVDPPASVDVGPPAGSTVVVTITLNNPQSAAIDAFGFRFNYPTQYLDFQDTVEKGALTANWTIVDAQENTPGQITVGGFHNVPTMASGELLKLIFHSTGSPGTDVLHIDNFSDDFAGASTTDGVINNTVPVELVSFSVNVVENTVRLSWATASETNNFGFDVEKSGDGLLFAKIGFVPGNGTTTQPQSYSFVQSNVRPGKHFYRLKQIDTDGAFEHSSVIEATVLPPARFSLFQNYPNPFNPETRIRFDIPNLQGENVPVQLAVYNLFGQLVRTLVNEERGPGVHEIQWDGRSEEGVAAPSGMYFYTVRAGEFRETKKMLLVR